MRTGLKRAVVGVALLGWVHLAGSGQGIGGTNHQAPPMQQPGQFPPIPSGRSDVSSDVQMRAAKARNDERQKRLVADTDKLLALATQLHDDVAKTNKDVLSLDVIKRADEIERLAHAVKERMRNS